MNKLVNFVAWPALAGLVFALVLLKLPVLAEFFPALGFYVGNPNAAGPVPAPQLVSFSDAIRKAAPAVVSINSQQVLARKEFESSQLTIYGDILDENSLGSGVIISPDGYIITSYHIFFRPGVETFLENSIITLSDGRNLEARVVKLDEKNDLALLKVDAENLTAMSISSPEGQAVGDIVLAIGNPRNIGQSVSLGIISALLPKDDSYVIQTDAAINPGNSGGALVDIDGNLIGINSTIISQSGGSEGIGFATPAEKAVNLMETYITEGPSGYLGVDSNKVISLQEGQRIYGAQVQGILISKVTANSPADKAGIRPGDIMTGVNDRKFAGTYNDAVKAVEFISSYEPGDTVLVEIFRNGERLEIPAILGVGEPAISVYPIRPEDAGDPVAPRVIN
ncbi:MAG: trypsin-like peptidase domain-containing protein [Pseudomonadales bacterium]|nr:trypsin-like peptidase domain-containing protein [Pseudomonadales bacterium]